MTDHDDNEQVLRDAQATIAGGQTQQAITDGTLTFTDYPPGQTQQILDSLPSADEMDTVPTSIRLPVGLARDLRVYAKEHGTTVSALMRGWAELMMAGPDRRISLADAVRVLSTLPPQEQNRAA